MQKAQFGTNYKAIKMKYLKEQICKAEQTITFQNINTPACVGIVDIVDSTAISSRLCNLDIAKYYTIFLNSMARIIHEHDGIVVKNVGDSLLYYFEMTRNEDKANNIPIECGITIMECKDIINELLKEEHLPSIQYRVSSEYGYVMIAKTNTINGLDVFGTTVNYCAKINRIAGPNEFVIGHDLKTITNHENGCSIREKACYITNLKNDFPVYTVRRTHD